MTEPAKQKASARARSILKGMYYSRTLRTVAYAPVDAFEGVTGRRDPLTPPRRLQYVGRPSEFEAVGAYWRDELVGRHGLESTSSVLDIGSGIGRNAVSLIPHLSDGRYEGFDVVPQFIQWCERHITPRHPNFRFRLADVRNRQYNRSGGVPARAFSFPYADDSFDLALAASVFTHMRPDEIANYLRQSGRVLRPGGRLICTFFLVDQEVEALIDEGRTAFPLDHRMTDPEGTLFRAADGRVPEFCIGVGFGDVMRSVDAAGLEPVGPVEHGWWSGRPGIEGAGYQDMLVLRRP